MRQVDSRPRSFQKLRNLGLVAFIHHPSWPILGEGDKRSASLKVHVEVSAGETALVFRQTGNCGLSCQALQSIPCNMLDPEIRQKRIQKPRYTSAIR